MALDRDREVAHGVVVEHAEERHSHLTPAQVDEMVAHTQETAENSVRQAVEAIDLSDVAHRVDVVRGMPFEVIRESAKLADVTVLGTLSRAGIEGVLIGNTAERVLHQVDCSVFAVKPPGFQTPLQLPRQNLELSA